MKFRHRLLLLLCCLLWPCLLPAQPATPRPPLGGPADAKLFNGKWYAVFYDKVAWPSAKEKCQRLGGQLVVIPDEATWKFVKELSQARLWLGATEEKVEGVWIWVDGSKMTFSAWGPGAPNNRDGKDNYLSTHLNKVVCWEDTPRDWNAYKQTPITGYICEWVAK